jgi:hypothetical protein
MAVVLPQKFTITFPHGNKAQTVRVPAHAAANAVAAMLGVQKPRSTLFISGGAGNMTAEAIAKTRNLIEDGIARFAAENDVVVIDGGTDVGIMQMLGQARAKWRNAFSLIGCAPEGTVTYPGFERLGLAMTTDDGHTRASLEPNHTHFVLVDADYWGAESDLIVGLTRAISGGVKPNYGVLINGGSVSKYDVYIASARGESPIPVLVVQGSGRSADEILRASKTGHFNSAMIREIVRGGKIEPIALAGGAALIYKHLQQLYQTKP